MSHSLVWQYQPITVEISYKVSRKWNKYAAIRKITACDQMQGIREVCNEMGGTETHVLNVSILN